MSEQTNDFTQWYLQTVQQAELMSYSPVRGSIIFRPDGFELWEHIQEEFNKFLKILLIIHAYLLEIGHHRPPKFIVETPSVNFKFG